MNVKPIKKISTVIAITIVILLVVFSSVLFGYSFGYKKGRLFQYNVELVASGSNSYYEIRQFIDTDFSDNPDIASCYLQKVIKRRYSDMEECQANSECMKYIESTIGLDNYTAASEKLARIKIDEANCHN